jgi:hypothetical protein
MKTSKPNPAPDASRILTLHPEGKSGVNIDRDKYAQVFAAIMLALSGGMHLTYKELVQYAEKHFSGTFDGSLNWYVEVVKLDLEARQMIRRLIGKPERYTLA